MRSYWSAILLFLCRDLPRLACFVERDEGEFALGHYFLAVPVAFASEGFGLERERRPPGLEQLDVNAELVADGHRAGEFDRVRRDQDRLAVRPPRREGAAGQAHLTHQPAAKHAAIGVGVRRHRGDADERRAV